MNLISRPVETQNVAIKIPRVRFEIVLLVAFLVLSAVVIGKAFILEDAYINFINIRNFQDGYYYSAIPDVRSQSATSNLWTLLLLAGSFFTNDLPNLTIFLAFICTAIAVILLMSYFISHGNKWLSVALPLVLAASTSFTDYSTSGLENPLSHMLLALFLVTFLHQQYKESDFLLLSFISSCLVMNRYDHCLVIAPAMLLVFLLRKNYINDFKSCVVGFAPLWLWFAFSWFYYGSIFPDTYYAKLSTGVPVVDRIHLAVMHQLRLLDLDPVGSYLMMTAIGISCALGIKILFKNKHRTELTIEKHSRLVSLGLGVSIYNLYFLYAGGDYMTGRLVSITIFLSAFFILLLMNEIKLSRVNLALLVLIFVLGIVVKFFNLTLFVPRNSANSPDGIVRALTFDMRRFQQNWYFLSQDHGAKDWRELGFKRAIEADKLIYPSVVEHESAGIIPYYAGPRSRLIDVFGLTDPLLSRLPCSIQSAAAHCMRKVPNGYTHFIQTGSSIEMEPDLADFAVPLYAIKTRPLFDFERVKLLIKFSFGKYESSRRSYIERHEEDYYKPGDANVLFHYAYQETILKNIFPPIDNNYKHPW